jgi:CDP-diacylglycerol--serine O-phosphatidyltransferase
MVGIAAVMDFLDGFVARLLNVHSEIGKQLDSLADMVTFGVVPGVVMFKLLIYALQMQMESHAGNGTILPGPGSFDTLWNLNKTHSFIPYLGFLITIFSAVRLAKFNIDTRQTDSFIGVPTPANSILICSLPLILHAAFEPLSLSMTGVQTTSMDAQFEFQMANDAILNPWFLISLTLIMSYLLIAELPLFALKFKNFKWADNKIRYIFLALCLVMLILFKYVGIPFIIVLYVVLSVINNIANRKTT